MYKIMESLNSFSSETAGPIFATLHMESVNGEMTDCSDGRILLNKIAAMSIYGIKTYIFLCARTPFSS